MKAVRAESDLRVAAIKESIAKEAETAKQGLEAQSDSLANQIADAVLGKWAA